MTKCSRRKGPLAQHDVKVRKKFVAPFLASRPRSHPPLYGPTLAPSEPLHQAVAVA